MFNCRKLKITGAHKIFYVNQTALRCMILALRETEFCRHKIRTHIGNARQRDGIYHIGRNICSLALGIKRSFGIKFCDKNPPQDARNRICVGNLACKDLERFLSRPQK